uniref:cysteine dioxygenase n=2 Tax=Oryza sativa subsp. japonica TaxID=39947 RepID=Q2R5Q1_ORYSJ|nr:hypothetical protein LOC_Os11g24220 [Oryza sativa Japonica Group]ABA93263.1 hypothetical protein LOC_Os11g24220 [Oryza sativa Japonica Group]
MGQKLHQATQPRIRLSRFRTAGRLRRCRLVSSPPWLVFSAAVAGGDIIFTNRLALPPSTGVLAYTIQIRICIIGIHGFKLISYASGMDQSEHYHRLAVVTADWCLRLCGWMVTSPLLGVYVFTAGLPSPSPNGALAYTDGWSHHRCWASTLSPPAAFAVTDWYLCLHGWPIMPPLMGVYDFTAGCLRHRRLVSPPARLAYYAAVDGRPRLHRRPPRPPPTGVSAYMAGLICRRRWASTYSPTGRLVRRRLVFPPARLAYYATNVGRLRLHRPAASSAADWCFHLHGWPIMSPLLDVYIFTDGPPCMMPTGAIVFTVGHVAATTNRRHDLQCKLSTSATNWFLHSHGCMILPGLIGLIVFTAGRLVCC